MINRVLDILRTHRPRRLAVVAISQEAGVSIGDVQEALQLLTAKGFRLDASPVEGVGLADGPQPMLAEELADPARRVGRQVLVFPEVESTNDEAFSYDVDGLCVFAECQSCGRGRRGSAWIAPPGSSLLFSLLLGDKIAPALPAQRLVLASAVAVAETLHEVADIEAQIKWPNDLLVDGRKIAGILVERKKGPGVVCRNGPPGASHKRLPDPFSLVIGIGLNVHQSAEQFTGELATSATSIRAIGGRTVDRVLLATVLLGRLDEWIAHAAASDGAAALHEQWRRRSATIGRRVELLHDQKTFTGTVIDIAPDIGLIVRLDSGALRTFEPATVHVGVVRSSE